MGQGLVGGDGHGVGQVQGTGARAHGNAHADVGIAVDEPLIEPTALAPEQQEGIGAIGDVAVPPRPLAREQVQLTQGQRTISTSFQ